MFRYRRTNIAKQRTVSDLEKIKNNAIHGNDVLLVSDYDNKYTSKKKHLKKANGNVAGTLGCGCMAYGHKSPTRKITFYGPGDEVDDVAAVFGNWHLTYLRTDYQLFKK